MAKNYVDTKFDVGNGCTIEGCGRRLYALGYCQAHYARNRKHGSPLGGRQTGWGDVRRWLETVAIPYDGDECLIFPFKRKSDGYAIVRIDGHAEGAHAFVLSRAAGPKESDDLECCHSCGNGKLGCVTSRHMRWDTHAANMADAVAHGTSRNAPRYREDHHDFRATDDVVEAIRSDLAAGMTQKAIAKKYGFGPSHISRINTGWGRFGK